MRVLNMEIVLIKLLKYVRMQISAGASSSKLRSFGILKGHEQGKECALKTSTQGPGAVTAPLDVDIPVD